MKKLRPFLCLLSVLLFSLTTFNSCSTPLIPPARLSDVHRDELTDAQLIDCLRADWEAMGNPALSDKEHIAAEERYNENLLNLLRRIRYDGMQAVKKGEVYAPTLFGFYHARPTKGLHLRDLFEDIVPAADVHMRSLKEHYRVSGVGVPLVGIIPAEKVSTAGKFEKVFNIRPRGTVATLTALLEFPDKPGARPMIRLIPRHRREEVTIGKLKYALAGDFSAPLEVYWDLTRVRDDRILGLLQPQELRDVSGLTSVEAYQPGRIPVILTHGLMSSAGTFDNLVNRLLSDPEIRRNFQFWYFNYPTGVAWTISAAKYREALKEVRRVVDPEHRNKNWDNMVVVGHSMGGLITHYSQCVEPWRMLDDNPVLPRRDQRYLQARYVTEPIPVPAYDALRQDYFFRPVKAGLVVYMATPHRGAPMARYRIVNALRSFVRLPERILDEAFSLATLQQDSVFFNPENFTSWFTSLGQLAPDSYSILGLQGLAVRNVPTHSIIGNDDGESTPLAKTSDGVVPYWSSHISWGTETVVKATHSVQDEKATAEDMKRVLKEHLARHPREKKRRRGGRR